MAKQVINIGTSEQAGDGEALRSAFNKVNSNFTELYNDDAADFDGAFASLTGKPTTIAGYGITDAATTAQGTKADNALQPTGISVSTLANAGSGTLTYVGDQAPNTGVLTYTPPDLSGLVSSNTTEVAIGLSAGETNQGASAVAVGDEAGKTNQVARAVAIGDNAGATTQGSQSVAIGNRAGAVDQSAKSVAIGSFPGQTNQGGQAVAIGEFAGMQNQGESAVAIGASAGISSQAANSIVINATGTTVDNTQASSLVITPIRNAGGTHALEYNPSTGEVTYDTLGGGAADTDAIPEGTTNLYYTDARADARAQIKIDALVDTAPGTMDTLNELASALGDDANFATTTATSIAEKLPLAGGTMTGAIDMGSNNITTTGKILFANMYAQLADLPSATTYHGMFAHVHATGAAYFAHNGQWQRLASQLDLGAYFLTTNFNTYVDLHLNRDGTTGTGEVLSWNGSDYAWVAQSGGGGGLANVVEDTTPQLGGDLDCQGFNITMNNGSISTTAGNLQLSSFNYITMDSANNGQIEIGKSSGLGDVIIGNESNGTSVTLQGVTSLDERALFYKGAEEKYSVLTGATGTVAHDCANGKMFHHTTPAADWTVNLTNLDLNQYKFSTSVGIVVTQGNTAYIPNAVQIAGAAQTIIWQGNSTPTGTANGTDAVSFTIMRDNATYIVLGQLTSFGGV